MKECFQCLIEYFIIKSKPKGSTHTHCQVSIVTYCIILFNIQHYILYRMQYADFVGDPRQYHIDTGGWTSFNRNMPHTVRIDGIIKTSSGRHFSTMCGLTCTCVCVCLCVCVCVGVCVYPGTKSGIHVQSLNTREHRSLPVITR